MICFVLYTALHWKACLEAIEHGIIILMSCYQAKTRISVHNRKMEFDFHLPPFLTASLFEAFKYNFCELS